MKMLLERAATLNKPPPLRIVLGRHYKKKMHFVAHKSLISIEGREKETETLLFRQPVQKDQALAQSRYLKKKQCH